MSEEIVVETENSEEKIEKSKHYAFTCTKCGRHVTINSDLYSKSEDKKAQHICIISE